MGGGRMHPKAPTEAEGGGGGGGSTSGRSILGSSAQERLEQGDVPGIGGDHLVARAAVERRR